MRTLLFILMLIVGMVAGAADQWNFLPYGGASCTWTQCANLTTGLVSYWKLDEASGTRYDSWGANNLTQSAALTSDKGVVLDCVKADNASRYLWVPSNNFSGTQLTVALWGKLGPAGGSGGAFISQDNGTSARRFNFYVQNNFCRLVASTNGTSGSPILGALVAVPSGVWVHWAATMETNLVCWYSNAVLVASTAITTPLISNVAAPIQVLAYNGVGDTGTCVDELAIWNRALSASEVATVYGKMPDAAYVNSYPMTIRRKDTEVKGTNAASASTTMNVLRTGLIHYWPLDESTGTRYDMVGSLNLTPQNSVVAETCVINNGINVQDSGNGCLTNSLTALGSTWSMALWVMPLSTLGVTDIGLFGSGSGSSTRFLINASELWFSPETDNLQSIGSLSFTANTWYHLGLAMSNATLRLYVNGVYAGANTALAATNTFFFDTIGDAWYAGEYNDSKMDEVAIWTNRVLVASEFRALTLRTNATPTLFARPNDIGIADTITLGTNLPNANTIALTNSLTNGLVAYWTMDEASGNRADSLGTNNLTLSGTIAGGNGMIGNCASNNSATAYLTVASNNFAGTELTVAGWATINDNDSASMIAQDNSSTARRFNIWSQSGKIYYLFSTNGVTTGLVSLYVTPTFPNFSWHHFAMTISTTKAIAYSDGVAYATNTITVPLVSQVFQSVQCFNYNGSSSRISLDEIGYWNRALTSKEVEALYNRSSKATVPIPLGYPFAAFVKP